MANKALTLLRLGVCVLLLVVVGLLAYAVRRPVLTAIAGLLIVDDDLQAADAIFVLNGGLDSRPFYAAELFEQGLAPQVVIARDHGSRSVDLGLVPNETDAAVEVLEMLGVPDSCITVLYPLGGVTSTYDEAVAFRDYVASHDVHSVILVTSEFHTNRARWIMREILADQEISLQVAAVPHPEFDVSNWWTKEEGLLYFVEEYVKSFHYIVNYR